MTTKIILVLIFVCFIPMTSLALATPKAPPFMQPPPQQPAPGDDPVESDYTKRTKQLNNDKCHDLEDCRQYYSICEEQFKIFSLRYCRHFCNLCSECTIPNQHPDNGTLTLNYTDYVLTATYGCHTGYYPSTLERTCNTNTTNLWTGSEPECLPVLTEKCNGSTEEYCNRVPHADCSGTEQKETCECDQGFEHSDNKTTCLEVYKNTDCDAFNSSSTCKNLEHSICVQIHKQSTMPSPSPMSTTTNASRKGRCECKEGFSYNQSAYSCTTVLNNACADNSTCNSGSKQYGKVENSYCHTETNEQNPVCKCIPGFAEKGHLCVKVLNHACTNDSSCSSKDKVENSYCHNETDGNKPVCKCKPGFTEKGLMCDEVLNHPCTGDTTCNSEGKVENSYCHNETDEQNPLCKCKPGFAENESLCVKVLNNTCTNNSVCNGVDKQYGKVQNSYCDRTTNTTNPVCKCKHGFAENEHLCVAVIGSNCTSTHSEICKTVAHAECSSTRCQCMSGFYLFDHLCYEVYLRNCSHNVNCTSHLNQSKCDNDLSSPTSSLPTIISPTTTFGQCICNNDYYYNNQTHSCDKGCKLPTIANANFNVVTNDTTKLYKQGVYITYGCNEGHEFKEYNSSKTTITCTNDGAFNATRNCSIKHCTNLEHLEHGNASMSSGDVFNSVATFSCNEGYTLNGINKTTCAANGSWTYHNVSCIINDCKRPVLSSNGSVNIENGTKYGDIVKFSCDDGFDINGESHAVCKADGTWNITSPECQIKECENLTVPQNAKVNKTKGEDYQSVATFSCNVGYNMAGYNKTTCQANATWTQNNVTCTKKDCGPPTISNGYGNATDNVTTYNSTAIYKCNAGYKLVGKNTSRCNESGKWENVPVCNRKDCGNLTDVENGTANMLNGTVFESVANFSCNKGYTLHGYNEITCTDTGTWEQHNVTCTIKDCGSPTISEGYGNATNNVTTYNSTALYTCNKGFELVGNDTSICNESGKWGNVPVCKRKNCGNLTDVDYGKANIYNGTVFESVANFSCNKGYTLQGYNAITCTYNGTWAQHNVTCIIKDCGHPNELVNGKYTLDVHENTVFNHSATYKCNQGYEPINETIVTCNASGNWSHPPPVCNDINECSNQSLSNCSTEGSRCINNPGSFSCQCSDGWTGEKCYTDIDECARYTAKCHPRAKCTNTKGNYTCKCYDGFKDISPRGQNGTECQDIDECSDQILSNCSKYGSDCINFQGGYFCRCNIGWTGEKCDTDIDECSVTSTCGEKANCTNFEGGYNCTCNDGFPKGDPKIHCYEEVIIKLETQVSPSRGDNELIASKPIHYRFPYFDDEYSTFRPNMDGFLSLGYQPIYEAYGPESSDAWKTFSGSHTVVAPFWTNIDTTNLTGGLYTHLFEKYTNYGPNDSQHRDLLALGKIFSDNYNLTGFKPRVAIVATWLNVTKSSYIEPIRLIKTQNATMQVILISDGVYSYLMFNYDHEQWSLQKDSGIPSSAGYSLQDKTGYIIATSANFSQLNNETNTGTGLNGRWIYNVSSNDLNIISKLKNESQCLEFRSNETIKDWITKKRGLSYPCPCSQQQMDLDYSYQVVDPWYKKTSPSPTCYEAWFFNNDGVRQTCCYSYGALKKDTGGGFATFENDRYNVVDYFYKCCDENTDRHLCHLFYEMNPSDDCTRFQPADEPVQRKRRFFVGYKRNKSG